MRFSAAFSLPLPVAPARPPEAARVPALPTGEVPENAGRTAAVAADLPDDLDARVRLVGEWQLGEPAE